MNNFMHDYTHNLKMQVHKTHDSCKATKIHIKLYSMHTALVLHGQDDPTMIFTRSSQVIPKLTGIQVGPTHVGPPSSNSMLCTQS